MIFDGIFQVPGTSGSQGSGFLSRPDSLRSGGTYISEGDDETLGTEVLFLK